MNLNNNWSRNIDTGKWSAAADILKKTDFDALKQEFKSYRFYQKCLSGSTYVGVSSLVVGPENRATLENVYDILNLQNAQNSYYFDSIGSNPLTYIQPFSGILPNNPSLISTTSSLYSLTDKVFSDYNLTLKNLFTPERLIKDQKENLFYVDLATTERLDDLNIDLTGLILDGVFVKEGHRILVKDQYTLVTIPTATNPDTFFTGYYEINDVVGTNTTYRIPSSDNGIYLFQNKRLVRTDDLDSYDKIIRYSICVKLGDTNKEKQYKLRRLTTGFFPEYYSGVLYPGGPIGESLSFEETHNWVLRQRVDYNNLYELSLQDTLKHGTQSLQVELISSSQSFTYSYTIPERTITVGEFGSIINDQEGITNFINNKYKTTFRSISQTNRYYWICGDEGIFIKVDKIDFTITPVILNFPSNTQQPSDIVITPLMSVHFFNDLRGAVVGKYNQIWVTSDSGQTWEQIYLSDFDGYNYNKIIFTTIDKFYVGGDNGVFIEFEYNLGNWFAYKRRISRYLDGLDDEYLLVDDIIDMVYFQNGSNSYVAIGCELNQLFIYDISNSLSATYSFLYLQDTLNVNNNFGDISGITWVGSTSSLFFSTFEHIYQLDPLSGFFGMSNSNVFSTTFSRFLTQSAINAITSYDNNIIYTGNFSLWQKSDLMAVTSSVYDSTFIDRLKPRLLFLDYDIGSKLYWFDDFGQYRIPERYEVPVSYLIGTGNDSHIGFNRNTNTVVNTVPVTYLETNWITYFKDRQKTFQYHTFLDQPYVVEPSFTFSSSDAVGKTFSYATTSVTNAYLDIVNLMPSAVPPMQNASLTQSSRFRDSGVVITAPSTYYSLFFYDYLGIWYENFNSGDVLPEVGDVLHISSDIFEGRFIINRSFTASALISPAVPAISASTFLSAPVGPPVASVIFISYGATNLIPSLPGGVIATSISLTQYITDIVTAINNDTSTTGFSAWQSGPNTISIQSPSGASYNGTYVTFTGTYNTANIIKQPFINGQDATGSIDAWFYFYTDFNSNILNNIPFSQTGFTVRDLNKYPLTPNSSESSQYFIDNFNKHYINHGYECELVTDNFLPLSIATQSFRITPKFSQFSAYYNLQATIDVLDVNSSNYSNEIKYASGFLNFGYSPTYNLLSYLNFINPIEYVPSKEFLAMPNWLGVIGPDNVSYTTQSGIYVDVGFETNKLNFGSDLKYIWDSLLKWTFVDVVLNYSTASSFKTDRLIIIDKYYDSSNDWYVIEFHDSLRSDYPGSYPGSGNNPFYFNIDSFDILSRRTLQQISDDLQYINRMHRPDWLVSESYLTPLSIGSVGGTWSNYETDINFKIPTDSYTKILLSDYSIIRDLTGILYTDYKYELAMQVTKLDREFTFNVSNIALLGSNYLFQFSEPHLLNTNDYVIVSMIGSQSSYPSTLLGYHNITVIDDYTIQLPVQGPLYPSIPNFSIFYTKKDYFFNFEPIDIFDMGVGDKKIKQSVEIRPEKFDVIGARYDLINLDLMKYKFRLIDGLDLVTVNSLYPWLLEAEISNATIGQDLNGNLVWYKGIWQCGRWFGGTWISGAWLSGDWYDGNWTSKSITDNLLKVRIDNQTTTDYYSIWYGGRWFAGNWENGTWYDGRWYGGTHSDGRWFDGTWNDGLWKNGKFLSGIWVLGQWDNGIFNTDNGPAFWLDGKFFGGDFENGVWYNGIFDQKNSLKSRFGIKASNSRNAIWRSGKFLSGQFHSFLNEDDNGNPDVSEVHKYSKWYTGLFSSGDFWGGLAYNINFKNTIWHGGISEDIEVVSLSTVDNTFTLRGEFDFNVNDEIYIVDNQDTGTFSYFGSTQEPKKYKVLYTLYDPNTNTTDIYPDVSLQNVNSAYLTEGSWKVVSVETNYSPTLAVFIPLSTYTSYVPVGSSANILTEVVDSDWFIFNQVLNYSQTNILPAPPFVANFSAGIVYDNSQINLSPLIGLLSGSDNYNITFGNNNQTATFSLTQDPLINPSGIIINFSLVKQPIVGTVSNLRCVSNFDNSIWNSGVWYNGVFKGGIFNGGVWYNGYFEGTWG